MQRYFVPAGQWSDRDVRIEGSDARHLATVIRAKPGDRIIAADGKGRTAYAVIRELSPGLVIAGLEEALPGSNEPSVRVTIAQGLPKGDKMETVIQKCTEIGAVRIIPFVSSRTVVQLDDRKEAKRLERWGKIAKEAAEQAHRDIVPEICPIMSWRELLARGGQYAAAFLCYEKESSMTFRAQLADVKTRFGPSADLLLAVGPEGGFSEEEAREALEAGFRSVSLGKRILRTETAALVGLGCMLYEYGEIGGS